MYYPSYEGDLQEYLEEVEDFDRYVGALSYIFIKIGEMLGKEGNIWQEFQNFYNANKKFFRYTDIDNIEYFDCCLFLDQEPNEIFCYIEDVKDFFVLDENLLEKIFIGEVCIGFYDNFKKIAVISRTFSIPGKVDSILDTIH